MNKKALVIVALIGAVAVALYVLFKPGGPLNSANPNSPFAVNPSSPFASTAAALSNLGTSLAGLLGATAGPGASTPTGTLSPVSAAAATNTVQQNEAYAYATDEINNTNYDASQNPIDAPISTTLSAPTEDLSYLNSLSSTSSSSYDLSADEDASGDFIS